MDRRDILKRLLYPKCKSAIEFQFDTLIANPLLTYITIEDIVKLNKIATSIKYSSKPKEKYAMIDKILAPRGFKKMASGTNRVTYRFLNDYRVVLKVAIDKVGLSDNGNEYRNQHLLKPFVTKCFEVSPCGTVGLFERVVPITSREEFVNISDDVFDLINNLIGKYVLEDIGEKFYMNYGLREGFGPVLLDYPYVFELDGRKLICNVTDPLEPLGYCGGEIDYDIGYNNLICTKCGKRYLATELKSEEKSDKPKIIIKGEDTNMKCVLKRGNEVVAKLNSEDPVATNTIKPRKQYDQIRGKISRKDNDFKNEKQYRPSIKTHDDVQLKARLRGKPKGKNIDKEVRRKEEILERNTPKIYAEFSNETPEVKEEPGFKAKVSTPEETFKEFDFLNIVDKMDSQVLPEEEKVEETKSIDELILEVITKSNAPDFDYVINEYPEEVKEICKYCLRKLGHTIYKVLPDGCFAATYKHDGREIWNVDENELIGYSCKDCYSEDTDNDCEITQTETVEKVYESISGENNDDVVLSAEKEYVESEEVEELCEAESNGEAMMMTDEDNELEPVEPSERLTTTIGDILAEKLPLYKGNENYKVDNIVSPISNVYAAKKEEEKTLEEKVDELEQEVVSEYVEESVADTTEEPDTVEDDNRPVLIIHPRKTEVPSVSEEIMKEYI